MGLFSKMEKLSEKYIEGFFKNKFSGTIQPIEIARYLGREMRDKKTVSLSGVYVPNSYQVYIAEADWDNFAVFLTTVTEEMQEYIVKKAQEKKYSLASSPKVEFIKDNTLEKGTFAIESKFIEAPAISSQNPVANMGVTIIAKMPEAAQAYLYEETGQEQGHSFRLIEQIMIIGRKDDSDIVLNDSNVSRKHAKIEVILGQYFIKDLDSTNGVMVNGVKIQNKQLEPGDRIKLGTTLLEFRVV